LAASPRTPCRKATGAPARRPPGSSPRIAGTLGQKYAGSPDYATAAVAYAVAQVLTDALARAGSASPGRLNTAIAQTRAPTVAGLITFNQSTHTATTPSSIAQWQSGTLVQVQPPAAGARLDVPTAGLG
jgi:ABC-type branched-subunit amino acid transport system substrate-binding protein